MVVLHRDIRQREKHLAQKSMQSKNVSVRASAGPLANAAPGQNFKLARRLDDTAMIINAADGGEDSGEDSGSEVTVSRARSCESECLHCLMLL